MDNKIKIFLVFFIFFSNIFINFKNDIKYAFDSLRLQILNKELNAKSAIQFLKKMTYITTKYHDFLIIEKDSENNYSFFSTDEKIMNSKEQDRETLNHLFEYTVKYADNQKKGKILFELQEFSKEIEEKKMFTEKKVLVLHLKENDQECLIYFMNNNNDNSRFNLTIK